MNRSVHSHIKRRLHLTVGAYLSLLLCCATAQAQPREAKEADVQSCRFLSRVSGDSGYGKNSGWQSLAKRQALQRAEQLGASDVVWERFTPSGSFNGQAEARVYHCATRQAEATQQTETASQAGIAANTGN